MAIYETSRPVPLGAVATLSVVNFFETAVADFREWNAERKTRNILKNLTDRQLEDIGLSRSDI